MTAPMTPVILSSGTAVPHIGLGTYLMRDVDACQRAVTTALQAGYRLIDTASAYGNERAVGRAIRESGVPREDIVLSTKLWPSDYGPDRARTAIAASLERLGTEYIDLLLLHQPVGDIARTWRVMEEAVEAGTVRSIGVSNFTRADLELMLPKVRIQPAVDQVELHPYWQQAELVPFLTERGIAPMAWYPIGHSSGDLLAEPVLEAAASAHGTSVVQVILRWHVQRGFIAIPKSTNPDHIAANLDVGSFVLTDAEMAGINALGKGRPMFRVPRWAMGVASHLPSPRQLA